MLRLTLVFCAIFALASQVCAQPMEDVVRLKNGGIIRGMIIEQIAGESLKIQTQGGNVFAYTMSEIAKIDQEPVMGMGASMPKKAALATGVEIGTLFGITHIPGDDNFTSIQVGGGVGSAYLPTLYVTQFLSERMAIGSEIAFARTSFVQSLTTLFLGFRAGFLPRGNSRSGIYALGQGSISSTFAPYDSGADFSAGVGMGYQCRVGPAFVLRMEVQYRRWLDASDNVLLVLGLGTRLGGEAIRQSR